MTFPSTARTSRLRGVCAVFTSRDGGVGEGDYATANLARHVGDDPEVVERNRARAADRIGAPLVFVDQVHSADVQVLPSRGSVPVATADALVTCREDIALGILVADCVPVLLSDPHAGVIAAAHAGRVGLLAGILENTLVAMQDLGADPARVEAEIGPSICGSCYEVPAAMHDEAGAQLPAVRARSRWSSPALDLRAGARAVLEVAGVARGAIHDEHPCTLEDESFFSYRRAARTGRFAGLIRRD